jgi:hypothetical protein
VFCPLRRGWWVLAASGQKTWEIRSASSPVGRALLRRTPPFPIVLRLGYSGYVVVAKAVEVRRFPSPRSIPREVLDGACASLRDLEGLGVRGEAVAVRFEVTAHGGK